MTPLTKYSNMELLRCPDCAALLEDGKCAWMDCFCKGASCSFSTTKECYMDSLLRVYKRLSSLDEDIQKRISEKYYDGQRPWKQVKGA